jgi:outer membrane protein assembly factor BamB
MIQNWWNKMIKAQPNCPTGWHFLFILTLVLVSLSSLSFCSARWEDPAHLPKPISGRAVSFANSVYVLSEDLYEIDINDGTERLAIDLSSSSSVPLISDENALYVGLDVGYVYSYDIRTLGQRWSYPNSIDRKKGYILRYLQHADSVVYAIYNNKVDALDSESGKLLWTHNLTDARSASADSSGVYIADSDDIIHYTKDGRFGWISNAGPVFKTRPYKDPQRDLVYVASTKGFVAALDSETGNVSWTYSVNGWPMSTPISTSANVIFGSNEGKVYAVNKNIGRLSWQADVDAAIWSEPLLVEHNTGKQIVLLGTNSNTALALDAFSGNLLFEYQVYDWVEDISLAVDDRTLLIPSRDGRLWAIYAWPICTIHSPANDEYVGVAVDIKGRAFSWENARSVELYIDGQYYTDISVKSNEFLYSLDTSSIPIGPFELQCRAIDYAGQQEIGMLEAKSTPLKSFDVTKANLTLSTPDVMTPSSNFKLYLRNEFGEDISDFLLEFDGKNQSLSSPVQLTAPSKTGSYSIIAKARGYEPVKKTILIKEDYGLLIIIGTLLLILSVVISFFVFGRGAREPKFKFKNN